MAIYRKNGNQARAVFAANGSQSETAFDYAGDYAFQYEPPTFLDTAVLTALSSVDTSGTKQGACTDGEYIYQTAGDSANFTYMQIIKYKIADGTYTTARFDGTPNFGHANDMTYNPNDGCLYVSTMLDDGSLIILDASTLEYVDTVYLKKADGTPHKSWQICFDRYANRLLSASGNNILMFNNVFQYVGAISIPAHPSATGQGCETDGYFFYRVTYNPNYIDVIRLSDGTRVKTMTDPMSGEPETMMYDWNGNYYLNCNTTGTIFYEAQLFTEA